MDNIGQQERLPIKVILPKQGTQKKNLGGGSSKLFREVDQKYRSRLSNQVNAIRNSIPFNKTRVWSGPRPRSEARSTWSAPSLPLCLL